MKSLLEHFNELANWDYYERSTEYPIENIYNWNNNQEHQRFIENFLKISGKSIVQNTFEKINNLKFEEFERLEHINSIFFLGCLLYQNTILNEKINFYRPDDPEHKRDEFYFIWFLTSLVHDFGYYIEKNIPNEVSSDIESLKSHIKGNSDKFYDLLSEKLDISKNLKILLENVPKYYQARMDGKIGRGNTPKIDHGIAAGLILYNTLKHIRIAKQTELRSFGVNNDIDEKNDLYWGDDLDRLYLVAASGIVVHNMRRAESDSKLSIVYQDYEMNDLILEEDGIRKISISDDPFLLLFSLADTIEPTKTFDCVKPSYALENILITFEHGNTIKICNKEGSNFDFEKLKKKVKGLDDWLDISLPDNNKNSITIKINQ